MSDELALYERTLVELLTAPDPVGALQAARADQSSGGELCDALSHIDPDGFELTAILIARLRFERLIQGSAQASAWFERDPQGFALAFKRYHTHVPPTVAFPSQEAALFEAWFRNA